MATAKRVKPRNPDVVLTLTWDEATYLHALTGDVGGGREGRYRALNDGIYEALDGEDLEPDSPALPWDMAPSLEDDN